MSNKSIEYTCAKCGKKEKRENNLGWASIVGVSLNGHKHPYICPEHVKLIMNYLDKEL